MNKILKIKTKEKNYIIEIGFNYLNKKLKEIVNHDKKIFFIIDKSVKYLIKDINFNSNVKIITIDGGEKIKSFKTYSFISNKILSMGVNRSSTIVAIGGGTVGDLAGFISSTVLRGLNFILVPTTLLSQVDSSIGGKNGINTMHGKNLIGTFYQPDKVLVDCKILKTLNKREIKSGYAEIFKHSLINNLSFFNWLNKNYNKIINLEKKYIEIAVLKSIKIKSSYIKSDTSEKLINNKSRSMLNFGHTFGHALETFYKYKKKISHGEAISIGMVTASRLSYKIGQLSKKDFLKIVSHLKNVKLPTEDKNIKNKKLFSIIKLDKKNNNDKINMIFLSKIGKSYFARNLDIKKINKIL